MLKSSRGALMWHGSNMRHFRRLLPPPLQQLLTSPAADGTAVLGRGVAAMPGEVAHQMGPAQVRCCFVAVTLLQGVVREGGRMHALSCGRGSAPAGVWQVLHEDPCLACPPSIGPLRKAGGHPLASRCWCWCAWPLQCCACCGWVCPTLRFRLPSWRRRRLAPRNAACPATNLVPRSGVIGLAGIDVPGPCNAVHAAAEWPDCGVFKAPGSRLPCRR